ncbi:MAG: hypothetical protein WCS72_10160, partial [Deltaproteobacteria bacterium]
MLTGNVYITQEQKNKGASVSIFEFMTPVQFAAWFIAQSTYDLTTIISAAIGSGAGEIRFVAGTYAAKQIVMKYGVSLRGASEMLCALQALASANAGFIINNTGVVGGANISGFRIYGAATVGGVPVNPTQYAILMKSNDAIGTQGGWWYSNLRDLFVYDFNYGIKMEGGTAVSDLHPIQFIKMEGVKVFKSPYAHLQGDGGRALVMSGQVDQVTGSACEFDGDSVGSPYKGTNIEFIAPVAAGGAPSNITFDQQTTIQWADQAVLWGTWIGDITFENCWIEGCRQTFTIGSFSNHVNIKGCRLANAGNGAGGGGVAGAGYIVSVAQASSVTFEGNTIAGAYDKVVSCAGNNAARIAQRDNYFPDIAGTDNNDTKTTGNTSISSEAG